MNKEVETQNEEGEKKKQKKKNRNLDPGNRPQSHTPETTFLQFFGGAEAENNNPPFPPRYRLHLTLSVPHAKP